MTLHTAPRHGAGLPFEASRSMSLHVVAEFGTIAALSATLVGAAQIRHRGGQITLAIGVSLLFAVVAGRVLLSA